MLVWDMLRSVVCLLSMTAPLMVAANVQLLSTLPNGASPAAMQLDSAGNIYVAGTYVPAGKNGYSTFVAKLTPGASQVLYFTSLSGTANDYGLALVLGSDGSAYVGGTTFSPDFPVTSGALLSKFNGGPQGFLAKLNPAGNAVYATYIGGPVSTQVSGLTLDRSGDLFLTGNGGPSSPTNSAQSPHGFVLELDPALTKVLLSTYGYGGGLVALDTQGNIFVAGSVQPDVGASTPTTFTLPPFPAGAFQPTHPAGFCFIGGSGPGGPTPRLTCSYQYVAKLDPAGALVWGTYLTGTYGAIPAAIAVDSSGNVIVAGTTYSDDYPVTPGSFQTGYTAAAPPYPIPPGSSITNAPPSTGYVTKVNSTGTALLWSTYFGGSYSESVTGLAIGPTGELFVSGYAASSDVPATAGTPDACLPSANQLLAFVTRMAPDGTTAGPTQLVHGAAQCLNFACNSLYYSTAPNYVSHGPVALSATGTALMAVANGTIAAVDFAGANRLRCVVDPADYVQLSSVVPGQLLSLFGTDLASVVPFVPATGVATSSNSFGVFFNGVPAPILYAGGQQINVQVPFEIAGQSSVQMKLVNQQLTLPLSETVTLGVAAHQSAVFLSAAGLTTLIPGYTTCGATFTIGVAALAVNADGTLNDCSNPALAGTTVTLFVDGIGPAAPSLTTGAIASAPAVPLTPAVAVSAESTTLTVPGAVNGIAQLQVKIPSGSPRGPYLISPTLNGIALRERLVLVWTRPN